MTILFGVFQWSWSFDQWPRVGAVEFVTFTKPVHIIVDSSDTSLQIYCFLLMYDFLQFQAWFYQWKNCPNPGCYLVIW